MSNVFFIFIFVGSTGVRIGKWLVRMMERIGIRLPGAFIFIDTNKEVFEELDKEGLYTRSDVFPYPLYLERWENALDVFPWLRGFIDPDEPLVRGAASVRFKSLSAFLYHLREIENLFENAFVEATRRLNGGYGDYSMPAYPVVFVVGSSGGGSGGGTFISSAGIIRASFPSASIIGYLLLPSRFTQQKDMGGDEWDVFLGNTYCLLQEIKHFQSSQRVQRLIGHEEDIPIEASPFDLIFLISAYNELGGVRLNTLDDATELLAKKILFDSLYASKRDSHLTDILGKIVEDPYGDKKCYASFSYQEYIFPREEIISYCAQRLLWDCFSQLLAGKDEDREKTDFSELIDLTHQGLEKELGLSRCLADCEEFTYSLIYDLNRGERLDVKGNADIFFSRQEKEILKKLDSFKEEIEYQLNQERGRLIRKSSIEDVVSFLKGLEEELGQQKEIFNCSSQGAKAIAELEKVIKKTNSLFFRFLRLWGFKPGLIRLRNTLSIYVQGKVHRAINKSVSELYSWLSQALREKRHDLELKAEKLKDFGEFFKGCKEGAEEAMDLIKSYTWQEEKRHPYKRTYIHPEEVKRFYAEMERGDVAEKIVEALADHKDKGFLLELAKDKVKEALSLTSTLRPLQNHLPSLHQKELFLELNTPPLLRIKRDLVRNNSTMRRFLATSSSLQYFIKDGYMKFDSSEKDKLISVVERFWLKSRHLEAIADYRKALHRAKLTQRRPFYAFLPGSTCPIIIDWPDLEEKVGETEIEVLVPMVTRNPR